MLFHDCATAPSPRCVRLFLAEKGVTVPVQQVDLMGGKHMGPAFRALNPWCTVPVLELDDGTCVSEIDACCQYLEAAYPEPPLMGRTAAEKGVIAMWAHRVAVDGIGAVAEALRNGAKGFKDRALTGIHAHAQIPELVDRGRTRSAHFLDWLDARLAESPFVAGDAFAYPDILALVAVDFARWIRITPGDTHPALNRWHAAVSARPSAQA